MNVPDSLLNTFSPQLSKLIFALCFAGFVRIAATWSFWTGNRRSCKDIRSKMAEMEIDSHEKDLEVVCKVQDEEYLGSVTLESGRDGLRCRFAWSANVEDFPARSSQNTRDIIRWRQQPKCQWCYPLERSSSVTQSYQSKEKQTPKVSFAFRYV